MDGSLGGKAPPALLPNFFLLCFFSSLFFGSFRLEVGSDLELVLGRGHLLDGSVSVLREVGRLGTGSVAKHVALSRENNI